MHVILCLAKDTICACWVKHGRNRVEKCVIYEVQGKDTKYLYDQMYGGTLFIRRIFQKEVCAYVGDVWLKWIKC